MTVFFIIISCLLAIGLGFAIWYIVNCLRKIQFITSSIEDLDLELQNFEKHLKYIYELDMYYGDQTLEGLIAHVKELKETSFADFRKDYEIFNGDINETDFFDKEGKDDTAKEENTREDLLHEGS